MDGGGLALGALAIHVLSFIVYRQRPKIPWFLGRLSNHAAAGFARGMHSGTPGLGRRSLDCAQERINIIKRFHSAGGN